MIRRIISATTKILVITITLLLASGCSSNTCTSQKNKLAKAKAPEPRSTMNEPYQVVGQSSRGSTMSEIKRELKNASGNNDFNGAIGALRAQALRETALSIGARGGLAERAQFINGTLLNYEPILDKIFNFYGMMLDDNVLSPVLVEARNTLSLSGGEAIRIADRHYKLISQARFVTAAPTWREYLWMSYDVPELPDRSLLPRNKPEHMMWERDIEEGWQAGLKQADLIYTENINRLARDYNGMILYRKLLAQNMVSLPYVASMDMGVTSDGENMAVNDRVLRITALPQLQADSNTWKTDLHLNE